MRDSSILSWAPLAFAIFAAGAVLALLTSRKPSLCRMMSHGFALCGVCALALAGITGFREEPVTWLIAGVLPPAGLALGLDRMGSFFLILIGVGAAPAAVYAFAYTRDYEGRHSMAAMGCAFNVFLAAMASVVMAQNVLTFLVSWELMSIASYFLVMTDHEVEETRKAGWLYLVMTHAGLACLLTGFLVITIQTGTMSFASWPGSALTDSSKNWAFALLALGFLSKAGAVPFHVWLPRAHPAAPSHVSALMSGVMIKLGIYGLIRAGFDWLGMPSVWWGVFILALAGLSAVAGVLYALVDTDLKRILAYSSVENVGVILFGVGAAMLFQAFGVRSLSSLALVAALLHSLNHAAFKSLLFFAAGAVVHATKTRNVEELGGLLKRMPATGALFLAGSLAIAALPPFNGFISEWLTFQSLLLSFRIPSQTINLVFALAIAALALTAGLAAACFVRLFGIAFLALPRADAAAGAMEVDKLMIAPMIALALACLAAGVVPYPAVSILNDTARSLTGADAELRFGIAGLAAARSFSSLSPIWAAILLAAMLVVTWGTLKLLGANPAIRRFETWNCGRALQTARFEYTATAFANPFKRVFALLYRPVEEVDIQSHPESRFFVETIAYRSTTRSLVEELIYARIAAFARILAARTRVIQSGNVHVYLLYMLIALLVVLMRAY